MLMKRNENKFNLVLPWTTDIVVVMGLLEMNLDWKEYCFKGCHLFDLEQQHMCRLQSISGMVLVQLQMKWGVHCPAVNYPTSVHRPARCENISSIGFPIGAATVVSPTAEEEELGSCSACTTSIQPRHLIETEIFDRNRNNKTHQLAI